MQELFVNSFVSGIAKTSGGLFVVGVCMSIWNYYNNKNVFIKTKETQTISSDSSDSSDYTKIFDDL